MKNQKIDQLTTLFFGTTRLIREKLKPAKKADPSTFLRMGTLRYISEHEHPTMQEVAKFLSITPPSATSLIEGLIQSGMISRAADSTDRRMVRLAITSKGRKTLEKAHKDMALRMRHVLGKLNARDIDDLMRIIKKLQEVYKK